MNFCKFRDILLVHLNSVQPHQKLQKLATFFLGFFFPSTQLAFYSKAVTREIIHYTEQV
jgi:hypothetical protein